MSSNPYTLAATAAEHTQHPVTFRSVTFRLRWSGSLCSLSLSLLSAAAQLASSICNSRLVLMTQKGGAEEEKKKRQGVYGRCGSSSTPVHPPPGIQPPSVSIALLAFRPLRPLSLSFHYLINIMELFILTREHPHVRLRYFTEIYVCFLITRGRNCSSPISFLEFREPWSSDWFIKLVL